MNYKKTLQIFLFTSISILKSAENDQKYHEMKQFSESITIQAKYNHRILYCCNCWPVEIFGNLHLTILPPITVEKIRKALFNLLEIEEIRKPKEIKLRLTKDGAELANNHIFTQVPRNIYAQGFDD